MTSRIAELAMASLDDPDAAVVLGDHVLETKWFDARVMLLLNRRQYERACDAARKKAHLRMASRGARAWARAVAAVVLFGEWPLPPWPPTMLTDARYTAVETTGEAGNIVVYRGRPPTFIPGEHPWPVTSRCYVESAREAWYGQFYTRAPGYNFRLTL